MIPYARVRKALNAFLATSLVHLFPPKHHARALRIIDEILAEDPNHVACLLGRAYILQHSGKWSDAGNLFAKVIELLPEDLNDGLRAKEEHAWCQCQAHDTESGVIALRNVQDVLAELQDRETDRARCLWRLGKCYWDMDGEYGTVFTCKV
jgi:superkiller protein 3